MLDLHFIEKKKKTPRTIIIYHFYDYISRLWTHIQLIYKLLLAIASTAALGYTKRIGRIFRSYKLKFKLQSLSKTGLISVHFSLRPNTKPARIDAIEDLMISSDMEDVSI